MGLGACWLGIGLALAADPRPPSDLPGFPSKLPALRAPVGDEGFVQLGLLNQFLVTLDVPAGGEATFTPTIHRLRADLRTSFASGALAFRAQVELAPTKLELLDYQFTSRVHEKVTLALGTGKVPFTRYRQQMVGVLHFVDWALTSRAFGAERQFGLSVSDGFSRGVNYALGVFTGTSTRASHGLGVADAFGTAVANPSRFADFSFPEPMHAEVVGHLGWSSAEATPLVSVDRAGGPARVTALASFAVDSAPMARTDLFARFAPEVFVQVRRVSFTGVGYLGWLLDRNGAPQLGLGGAVGEVTWAAHRWIEVGARYAVVARLDALEADVTELTGAPARGPALQQEVGVGWGSPMIGDHFDWSTDVRYVDGLSGRGLVVRSQIQVML